MLQLTMAYLKKIKVCIWIKINNFNKNNYNCKNNLTKKCRVRGIGLRSLCEKTKEKVLIDYGILKILYRPRNAY
jgi:hypothetical protein